MRSTIVERFLGNAVILIPRDIIRLLGRLKFMLPNLRPLRIPTHVDSLPTPLSTLATRPDLLAVDLYEDRVGVRAWKDPHRNPA
jgi:hypothetical protein